MRAPGRKRTPAEFEEIRAGLVRVWNYDPDITPHALSQRFRVAIEFVNEALDQAFAAGATKRARHHERQPNRPVRRQGALTRCLRAQRSAR